MRANERKRQEGRIMQGNLKTKKHTKIKQKQHQHLYLLVLLIINHWNWNKNYVNKWILKMRSFFFCLVFDLWLVSQSLIFLIVTLMSHAFAPYLGVAYTRLVYNKRYSCVSFFVIYFLIFRWRAVLFCPPFFCLRLPTGWIIS